MQPDICSRLQLFRQKQLHMAGCSLYLVIGLVGWGLLGGGTSPDRARSVYTSKGFSSSGGVR